jgi:hypothetical protein
MMPPHPGESLSALKKTVIRAGLETLYFSGAHLAMKPFVSGVGVILTLHHVGRPVAAPFSRTGCLKSRPPSFPR